MTALERDRAWLQAKGLHSLDLEEFSFWVAREMEYGRFSPEELDKARCEVVKFMECEHE